jgi:hypothetical protein
MESLPNHLTSTTPIIGNERVAAETSYCILYNMSLNFKGQEVDGYLGDGNKFLKSA